ncbi:MAG: PEGA domain-containing protein, partial [Bacteroidota bacterium]
MRHITLLLFLMWAAPSVANEFRVVSFEHDENDLAALKYERHTINGETAAIIKVLTYLDGVRFESNSGVVGDVVSKTGEYWVYVVPGERRLRFIKDGFIPMAYNIPENIEGGNVYTLVLKREGLNYESGKGSLLIDTEPQGAAVTLEGYPDVKKTTPAAFNNYKTGIYRFHIRLDRHHHVDTVMAIEKDQEANLKIQLQPVWADVKLVSNVENTTYYFNGRTIGQGRSYLLKGKEEAPDAGQATIRATHPQYYAETKQANLQSGRQNQIKFDLKPKTATLKVHSEPSGATVLIDEEVKGKTPLEPLKLLIGPYKLEVRKPGYLSHTETLNLKTNQEAKKNLRLKDKKQVTFTTNPEDADFYIEGKYAGKTPVTLPVALDNYSVKAEKEHYETLRKTVEVDETTSTVSISLEKERQPVEIKTKPVSGNVAVNDGTETSTPLETRLLPGKHKVTLSKPGYHTINRRFRVKHDKKVKTYKLKPKDFISVEYANGVLAEGIAGKLGISHFVLGFKYEDLKAYDAEYSATGEISRYTAELYTDFLTEMGAQTEKVYENDAETAGINVGVHFGLMMHYPFPLSIYGGYAWKNYTSYSARYRVENEFRENGNTYTEGTYLKTPHDERKFESPYFGAQLFLRIGKTWGITVSGDYYLNTEPAATRQYALSAGLFVN